nr:hypothetical protein [Brevundimonas naejangsanensis]
MTRSPTSTTREATTRIQVYVSDPRTLAALRRASRTLGHSLSETAARALTRGLARSTAADPDDRLLALDRALRRHMAVAQRDMQITQELIVELARPSFSGCPMP